MSEEWRAGLCDACAMGEVAQWTGRSWCIWTGYNCFLPCCAATHLRGIVRERQDISGSCCGDCMASLCCYPCATQQLYTESRASAHEQRNKQRRMEAILEQQANEQVQRALSPPPPQPQPTSTTTVVFAPSPPPMHYHPQAVYPMAPPHIQAYPPPPPSSAGDGPKAGAAYYLPNGKPAY